jgi:hypothetical protein
MFESMELSSIVRSSSTTFNMNRYNQICKLVNEEIDEIVEEDFETSGYDSKEHYRDSIISNYLDFLIKDLQSDNA